jgi:DNA-binding response OmpR family regulator
MNNLRVLYVDDDSDDREMFQDALQTIAEGAGVEIATDGLDAFRQLETFSPDIIFLDLNMPQMDGFEFLEKYRASNQQIPVVIFTTSSDETQKKLALDMGAQDFITKPLNFGVLKSTIATVLDTQL